MTINLGAKFVDETLEKLLSRERLQEGAIILQCEREQDEKGELQKIF